MKKSVWKFKLTVVDEQTLNMPKGARPLHLGVQPSSTQQEDICLWAEVDVDALLEPRQVFVRGTGHPLDDIPEEATYVGTVILMNGRFVLHVWML
jgi:hypothetical protein